MTNVVLAILAMAATVTMVLVAWGRRDVLSRLLLGVITAVGGLGFLTAAASLVVAT